MQINSTTNLSIITILEFYFYFFVVVIIVSIIIIIIIYDFYSPPTSARSRKHESIPAFPHSQSWHSAKLAKHRNNFTFIFADHVVSFQNVFNFPWVKFGNHCNRTFLFWNQSVLCLYQKSSKETSCIQWEHLLLPFPFLLSEGMKLCEYREW
jgi:hypothetical protein